MEFYVASVLQSIVVEMEKKSNKKLVGTNLVFKTDFYIGEEEKKNPEKSTLLFLIIIII